MGVEELYNYLDGFENSTNEDIFNQITGEWTQNQISATVETLFSLIQSDYFTKPSFFNFCSNSALAGGLYPCFSPTCRLSNIDSLARFSALYADKVLIPSPMDVHYNALTKGEKINASELAMSILIILKLKPLIESHIIGFYSSYLCLCNECLKKITKREKDLETQLNSISKHLSDDLIKTAHCTLQRDINGVAYFAFDGLEKYGYHRKTNFLIQDESSLIKKLLSNSKGEIVNITPKLIKQLGLSEFILAPGVEDIYQAQILTEIVDSSYLTDRPSDAEIIDKLRMKSGNELNKFDSKTISKAMFHTLPLVGNATIDSIVKLRQNNEDSFLVYRDSINHFLKNSNNIDIKSIEELQQDIIIPEIHKMRQTIKLNRKALIKNSCRDMVFTCAGISLGLFSGILPLDYAAVLGIIGGTPAIAKIITDLKSAFSDEVIKNNSFYFLWKLGQDQEEL